MISTFVLSAMLSLAAAQADHTMTVQLIGGDADMVAASVVSANSDATTLALACVEADCGLFPAHTLVVGPSTYHIDMSDPNTDFTATQDCVVASSSAVCMEMAGGSEANFPGSSTETYDGTYIGKLTVTVTAGEEQLLQQQQHTGSSGASEPPPEASRTAEMSGQSSVPTARVTPAPGSGTAAASASASRTGSAPAQASTAGAAVNAMVFGGGFVGAAAGVFGGLLL